MTPSTSSRLSFPADRRGNTLVLVTAILVLLVIIATAYISRAQGGRVIAAAQRNAIDREDRASVAAGVVAKEISEGLFPKLVDSSDPAVQAGFAALSSTPRLSRPEWTAIVPDFAGNPIGVTQQVDRYAVDPQTQYQLNGSFAPLAPYNTAPYETKAWTNWPDSQEALVPFGPGGPNGSAFDAAGLMLGDDNPLGNPGFGDSRWLRSSEPQRAWDDAGNPGFDQQTGQAGFTHWSHLSWPATAENGWRVCFDLANVAPFSLETGYYDPYAAAGGAIPRDAGFTLNATMTDAILGGATDYALAPGPVALQTPYEQWLPGMAPAPYGGAEDFIQRRNRWFSRPSQHFSAVYTDGAMPNFIRLNDLGPKRYANIPNTDRNVVERTLADADGDGFTDSFWFLIPGVSEDGVRQVAAVSVVDNASMVDINTATRFDRWSTAGHTPADAALTSRLVVPAAQASAFSDGAAAYDTADTFTGLLSDPQNATPRNAPPPLGWGLNVAHDTGYEYRSGTFDDESVLGTRFNPYRFGDSTLASTSFLRQVGVLNQAAGVGGFEALEDPYASLLVAFGDGDPTRAAFDRRRYFRRRLDDGGLYTIRRNLNDGTPLPVNQWFIGSTPPRSFADADELELRMFAGSNYGPVVSTLERTLNDPWDYEANFLRSTLARSESVENHLDFFDGNPNGPWPPTGGIAIGDQLSAAQLLGDQRHRMTTYSSTRNDLRPLHLRPTALYDQYFDYAYGRLRPDPTNPAALPDQRANRIAYDVRKRKLDLRAPLDAPLTEFESILYRFFPGPFFVSNSHPDGPDGITSGVWPYGVNDAFGAQVELDRAFRFRLELQRTIADAASALYRLPGSSENYTQSYLGSNYEDYTENQLDYLRTQMMAASWAANVDTFRDARGRPAIAYDYSGAGSGSPGSVVTIDLDTPIYPDWAPSIDQSLEQFLPPELQNLSFPGMEKQPFIMESFFCLVYPPSRITSGTFSDLEQDQAYQQFLLEQGQGGPDENDDEIPVGFRGSGDKWVDSSSEPAIVFAIQLANPFEEPVALHDLFLRIGDSQTVNQCLNLGKLPSPHPLANPAAPYYATNQLFLGPTQPDAPRTAIVFGVIPPGNDVSGGAEAGSFESDFGMPYEEFHRKWMDFLDLEPGALFGWEADQPLASHQTLVLDASPQTFIRPSPTTAGQPFTPVLPPLVGLKPERWFGDDDDGDDPERSVELLKYVANPLTYNPAAPFASGGYLYAIDRLDNALTGEKVEFKDQLSRLVEEDFAPTMDQEYEFEYPGDLDRNAWSGIRLEGGDLLASWVRAGRAWGWDVNRNGVYDLDEISPRYMISELPEEDWIRTKVDAETVDGAAREVNAVVIDFEDDPDGGSGSPPWLTRSYLSPIGLAPATGTAFGFDFATIRAKPVHLTTATALVPGSVGGAGTPEVDYDAGFPTLPTGAVRTAINASGWPGRPAQSYRWVMMDKGQAPEESIPGSRSGLETGGDSNGNGVDDGLETYQRVWLEKDQWAYPLQMLQKDADFEQVGELANTFLWGHALRHRRGITTPDSLGSTPLLPTVYTFGEIMNSKRADDPLPVLRSDLVDSGVPNPSRIRTNRFFADPGNLGAQPGSAVESFRPFTQVVEVATIDEPWTPRLPAGLSLFDAVVCDGPGCNYRLERDGFQGISAVERLAIEDDRFNNAAGFSGRGTRGLINVNTASVEAMRTLPHMSRLVWNDNPNWPGTINGAWVGLPQTAQVSGDVAGNGTPRSIATRNPQWVRVPESIVRYRDGGGLYGNGAVDARRIEPIGMPYAENALQAFYDDRGTYNYAVGPDFATWVEENVSYPDPGISGLPGLFPGMRRTSGIVSVGELLLLNRDGIAAAGQQSWPLRSGSIEAAARNPYSYQAEPAFGSINLGSNGAPVDPFSNTPAFNSTLGLSWRPPSTGGDGSFDDFARVADARLSTDRRNLRWQQVKGDPSSTVEIPDSVASDAEEANLLFAGISNMVSVRSDTFTVHLKIRSFKQNPVTGVWNAMDPEYVVDDSRYVFVVDRSGCDAPGEEPEIRLFAKIPN